MFSDLVLAGNMVKIANNLYFGGDTEEEFVKVFQIVLSCCEVGNLRLKPKKIKLNIQSADILRLHWQAGIITPSVL